MFGSVLARAIIRRGTWLADLLISTPQILIAAQIGIVTFEMLSPLIFLTRGRWRTAAVLYFYSFHVVTFAMITISFAPHLVAMASFLPLERVRPIVAAAHLADRLRDRTRDRTRGRITDRTRAIEPTPDSGVEPIPSLPAARLPADSPATDP
jgi:hypothetical protein